MVVSPRLREPVIEVQAAVGAGVRATPDDDEILEILCVLFLLIIFKMWSSLIP